MDMPNAGTRGPAPANPGVIAAGLDPVNPLRDPRVHAIVQDGRFFLQASPRQYDIISGEPPPPKVAGAVNLEPVGEWRLRFSRSAAGAFANDSIDDILFAVSIEGRRPPWP